MPGSHFDGTAVFCRPWQLREAAITLSCVPSDHVVPLVVLEPPPLSRAAYAQLYTEYTAAREESMKNVIGFEYHVHTETMDWEKTAADMRRHRELHEQLSAPRSWLVHNRRWRELLNSIPCERAVFLFDPAEEDLMLWPPSPGKDIFGRPGAMDAPELLFGLLPAAAQIITFASSPATGEASRPGARHVYDTLQTLTDIAWAELTSKAAPSTCAQADPADPASILIGLHEALENGIPLRLKAPERGTASAAKTYLAGPKNPSEAVIIEASDSASAISGVLYARHRGVGIAVYPPPDRAPVQAAISRFIQAQRETNQVLRMAATAQSLDEEALKRLASESTSENCFLETGAVKRSKRSRPRSRPPSPKTCWSTLETLP